MKINRHTLILAAVLLSAVHTPAFAQKTSSSAANGEGLNATVKISNDYRGDIPQFEKSTPDLPMPDSLYRFDLNFDYGGFENPYKGTDYFNPFLTDLDLAPRNGDSHRFYMKAGAGYTLAPTFDLQWTFNKKGRFHASTFASHRSYWGNYSYIEPDIDGMMLPDAGGEKWRGYESKTNAGFCGRLDFHPLSIRMKIWYEGVQSSNRQVLEVKTDDNLNRICGSFALSSNPGSSRWRYGLDIAYSYAFNSYAYEWEQEDGEKITGSFDKTREENIKSSAYLGYSFGKSALEVGFNLDLTRAKDNVDDGLVPDGYDAYWASVTPKYIFSNNRVYLSAGLSFAFSDGHNARVSSRFSVFPDLNFKWSIVPSYLDLYSLASIKGGLCGFAKILNDITFPIFPDQYTELSRQFPLTRFSNFVIGLRGNFGGIFHYDLSGGLENDVDKLYYMPEYSQVGGDFYYIDTDCESHGTFYGQFKARLEAGGFFFKGGVRYNCFFKESSLKSVPSHLTFDAMAKYTILKRVGIYVGADYRSRSSVFSNDAQYYIPAFVDLYAGLDYKINSKVTVYVDGHNLLDDCLQYLPGFARKSICLTGGLVLKFQ